MNRDSIKNTAMRMCLLSTILLLQLAAIELGSCAVLRYHAQHPSLSDLEASVYRGKDWAKKFVYELNFIEYAYYPFVVWGPKPVSGETITVDEGGVRRTTPSHCGPGAYVIFMFGGSTLWGVGVPDWETIPSELAKLYQQNGRSACVINFGAPAYVSTQEVIKLILDLKGSGQKPNLVIFYDGVNDTHAPYLSGRFDAHLLFNTIKNQFEEQSVFRKGTFEYLLKTNTAELIRGIARKVGIYNWIWQRSQKSRTRDFDEMARQIVSNYLKNIELVDILAKTYDFDYAFFWQKITLVPHKPLTPEEEQYRLRESLHSPGFEVLFQKTYQLVRSQNRSHLYYIADVFQESPETLYLDSHHVSTQGNRLIAQRMYRTLVTKGQNTSSDVRGSQN